MRWRLGLRLSLGLGVAAAIAGAAWLWQASAGASREPLVIGVLHSLSGTMASSEEPLAAAVQLAVDEINAAGGLLGRQVQLRLEDSRSDPATAAALAARLIDKHQAVALFGCWTSACRKAVKPVVEARKHLLFYPVQYEGLEQSPHIIYLGATPNQQLLPGADWAMQRFGRRVYLLGSDYVFPRTANALLRDFIPLSGGQVLGERYLPLGATDMGAVVAELRRLQPDVVLNTINGDSNAALFQALAEAGLGGTPMLSFSAAEPEMRAHGGGRLDRHFAVWSYFQSTVGPQNDQFLARYRRQQGETAVVSDPVVHAYLAVQLWAAAVREVGSARTDLVNANLSQQSVTAPQGIAAIDGSNRHLWRQVRIGQVKPDGQLLEVFALPRYIKPEPWPAYRSVEQWAERLRSSP